MGNLVRQGKGRGVQEWVWTGCSERTWGEAWAKTWRGGSEPPDLWGRAPGRGNQGSLEVSRKNRVWRKVSTAEMLLLRRAHKGQVQALPLDFRKDRQSSGAWGARLSPQSGRTWGNRLPVIAGQVSLGCLMAKLSESMLCPSQTRTCLPCPPSEQTPTCPSNGAGECLLQVSVLDTSAPKPSL